MRTIKLFACLVAVAYTTAHSQTYVISTVAGTGVNGYSGDGGPATAARLNTPFCVTQDTAGNLYIAEHNCVIRKVGTNGIISTIAGTGVPGFSGDGGPATSAQLKYPQGVLVDRKGNIFIGDAVNNRIRKIDTMGIITTIVGTGGTGSLGDGGPATSAEIYQPFAMTFDSVENLYVADWAGNRIRKIGANGIINTVAGSAGQGFAGDGGQATLAKLYYPDKAIFDSAGNMYIADTYNQRIRKITPAGIISTIAGTGAQNYSGDGGPALAAELNDPSATEVDPLGQVIFSDWNDSRVRRINLNGTIETIAGNGTGGYSGDGGLAVNAQINCVNGIYVNRKTGVIYLADRCNDAIRMLTPTTTGIKKVEMLTVSTYPNPVTNMLFISAPQPGTNPVENSEIEILNALGQPVLRSSYHQGIDVSKLSKGYYSIKLSANNKETYYSKFVKE